MTKLYGNPIIFADEPDEERKRAAAEQLLREAEKAGAKEPRIIYMMSWEGEAE